MNSVYHRIYRTRNYNLFVPLPGQRPVCDSHVANLKKSIVKDNRLEVNQLKVFPHEDKEHFWIYDGRHRLQAAKELELEVFFIVNENIQEDAMIDDQIQLKWSLKDYLNYHIEKGRSEYIKIKDLIEKYEMPFTAIFSLLGWHKYENGELFRQGTIVLPDSLEAFVSDSYELRKYLLQNYSQKNLLYRRDFIHALFWFWKRHRKEFPVLAGRLKKSFDEIEPKSSRNSYEKVLIREYNKAAPGRKSKRLKHPDEETDYD